MSKFYNLILPLLLAGTLAGTLAANATNVLTGKMKAKPLGAAPLHLSSNMPDKGFGTPMLGDVRKGAMATAPKASDGPILTQETEAYGYIGSPDGTYWMYTQSYEANGYYYGSSTFTIYDGDHNVAGTIKVDVPDTLQVNQIALFGDVTSKLFDRDDASKEVLVELHAVGNASNNYADQYITRVYHLDGSFLLEFYGSGMLVNEQVNAWTKYQRFILSYAQEEDGMYVNRFDVIKAPGWNATTPTVEHSFAIDPELLVMSDLGAPINVYFIDGKAHYVLSHYAKPYVEGIDSTTYEQIYATDNRYIVKSYNEKFQLQDSLSVALNCPSGAFLRMASFGTMSSDDLSKNYFTNDGKLAYVVTFYDYMLSDDDYKYAFVVYDSKGDSVKTVCDNVVNTYQYLADVKGHETQVLFMQSIDGVEQVQMVDVPSCTKQTTFPAVLNGQQISTDINRCPKGDDYIYVMKMGTGDVDEDGNLIARLGWFNRDLSLDHYTIFNLGPRGQLFTPNMSNTLMSPYVFNTDDALEYLYIAKIKQENSTTIDTYFRIGDEQGNVIKEWGSDDAKGKLYSANLMTFDPLKPELVIVYLNQDTEKYTLEYYSLPFSKFSNGGDGTSDNPYVVSTTGDMMQVAVEPSACYKMANDIDLSTANQDWQPIDAFSGTFDGDGHALGNLSIETTSSNAGLFSSLSQGAKIKNLTIVGPVLNVTSDNQYAGVLAAQSVGDTISNIHVFDAAVNDATANTDAITGGIVGRAALYSLVDGCSFRGTINLPSASSVGGVAGELLTSSAIKASATKGQFTAANGLGGMVGSMSTGTSVSDCRADIQLHANHTVGGIVGDNGSRGGVANNVATGTILADAPRWRGLSAAGIIGYLGSDWTHKDTVVVKNNVSAVSVSTNSDNATDTVAHAIVGWTIANETYEAGEKHYYEVGLANNYVADTVTVLGKAVTSVNDKSVDGAKMAAADFKKVFFTDLDYAYGDNTTAPWKGNDGLPVLFFDNEPLALLLSSYSVSMEEKATASIMATVYGSTSETIDCASSDANVADVEINPLEGNKAEIRIIANKAGSATINITAGNVKVTCLVTVGAPSGIANVSANGMGISFGNGSIVAEGASAMSVFSLDGKLAAQVAGNTVATGSMGKGVYVVVATGKGGMKTTSKIVIK